MCHVNCHVHIYGILPKKIIKTLEKACQNYYNYNLEFGTLSLEFGYSVVYAASKPEAKVVCSDFWGTKFGFGSLPRQFLW